MLDTQWRLVVNYNSEIRSEPFSHSRPPSRVRLLNFQELRAGLSPHRLSGNRRRFRAALAVAAFLAQVHLFFVVELHHHEGRLVLSERQGQVAAHLAKYQAAQKCDVICAACMMCRQGAVRPATSTLPPCRDSTAQKVSLIKTFKFSSSQPSRLSSRAPPLS